MEKDLGPSTPPQDSFANPVQHPGGAMHAPRRVSGVVLVVEPHGRHALPDPHAVRDAGYDVVVTNDPKALLLGTLPVRPDLIITPLASSAEEAVAFCRELRSSALRAVPIVIITRSDDLYIREQIVRAGGTAILVEPLKTALLLRQIRRLLVRSALHRPQ
jgi:DNA-binding response OmpR family regulator